MNCVNVNNINESNRNNGFAAYWLSILFYFIITEIVIVFRDFDLLFSGQLWLNRLTFAGLFLLNIIQGISHKARPVVVLVATYAGLTLLYKETALLNQLFYPVMDPLLIRWDGILFGYQPSLEFSKVMDGALWSELMFLGYTSYYLMPLIVIFLIYRSDASKVEEFGFILITAFLMYYTIFIFFPAVGPQFYFKSPENQISAQGIFGNLVKLIQKNGEAPTAAFPSSHVGISIIILIWLWNNHRKYVFYFIPNVLLLVLATVYIKAHYAVDVLAGILTAPIIYYITIRIFKRIKKGLLWTNN